MPTLEQVELATGELRIIKQTFGGKLPVYGNVEIEADYLRKGRPRRGQAPGRISYEDITSQQPELVAKLRTTFKAHLQI